MTKSKLVITFSILTIVLVSIYVIFQPLINYQSDSFETKVQIDLKRYGQALALYRKDNGHYPSRLDELVGDYFKRLTPDPWGKKYKYISDGTKAIIFTYPDHNKNQLIYRLENEKM